MELIPAVLGVQDTNQVPEDFCQELLRGWLLR